MVLEWLRSKLTIKLYFLQIEIPLYRYNFVYNTWFTYIVEYMVYNSTDYTYNIIRLLLAYLIHTIFNLNKKVLSKTCVQICLSRVDTQLVLPLVYDMQQNVTQLADKQNAQPHLIAVSLHLKR